MTEQIPNRLEKICRNVAYGGVVLAVTSLAKIFTDVYYNITTGSHDIDEKAGYGMALGALTILGAGLIGGISYDKRMNPHLYKSKRKNTQGHTHGIGGS